MTRYPFSYRILRSGRKTISIQISPTGQVTVRCPWLARREDIHRFLAEKSPWIEKHLAQIQSRPALPPLTPEEVKALAVQAKASLVPRVAELADRMGISYGRITIRSQRSRWGSCSAKGNLNFNCLLMLTPPEVRDYVIVHELCHRKQLNHSPAFWAEVEAVLPHYRESKQWLKTHGSALIGRLPQ